MTELRTAQVSTPADVVNFGIGQPDMRILPVKIMKQAAAHRLGQHDPAVLNYGVEPGDGYFRKALAAFLSDGYGEPVDLSQLLVTAGASQALDIICTLFTQAGDTIFVEEPSYFLALRIFEDHRLNVVSLPMDEEGLIVEAVEEALTSHRPKFLYTIPTFHNPSAVTLSQARRERLVELSQARDFLIVADEVYHLLHYTAPPPRPLAHYLNAGTVLSVGSFSKILAPGLRLGWVQTSPKLWQAIAQCGLIDSGGGLNHFTSTIVRSVLELGLQKQYLSLLKETYSGRVAAMHQALQEKLPGAAYVRPNGGFFFWLNLPEEVDTRKLIEQAAAHKVGFQMGPKFSSQGGLQNCMRLSFAFYDEMAIAEGVSRLAALIHGRK